MEKTKYHEYLKVFVHPILEKLVAELILLQPTNVLEFASRWFLKQVEKNQKFNNINPPSDSLQQSTLALKKTTKYTGRSSISAEVIGIFNRKKTYHQRIIQKNQEQFERIQNKIAKCFIFGSLDSVQLKTVIDAMEEKRFKAGEWIIKQHEDGKQLFIVDAGELNCFKQPKKGEISVFVKLYTSGDSFGELSLLYNVPRQASVQAKTDCVLWALDRHTFNSIVRESAIKRKQKYQRFLKEIDIFRGVDEQQLQKIVQSLKVVRFFPGEYVCRQGEEGYQMYVVEQGQLSAIKSIKKQVTEVKVYRTGQYFGQLALMRNGLREASIVSKKRSTLLSFDLDEFRRFVEINKSLFVKNIEKYAKKLK